MDVNIGNDICVKFKLSNVKTAERADVKYIECYFINDDNCDKIGNIPGERFPQYCVPTEYTIRSCGHPTYNVNPCMRTCYMQDHFCGFGVNARRFTCGKHKHCGRAYGCNIPFGWTTLDSLKTYFPQYDQKYFGDYRFVVKVALREEGWGDDNIHEYTIDYGKLFKLVKHNGKSGDIEIEAPIVD